MILKLLYTEVDKSCQRIDHYGHSIDDKYYEDQYYSPFRDDKRYVYELEFSDDVDEEHIKERMFYVYDSAKDDVEWICLPERDDGHTNNAWHWIFDRYSSAIQPFGKRGIYYSFPPVNFWGRPHPDREKTMDPRVVIDGLLQDEEILKHLTELRVYDGEKCWRAHDISRDEALSAYRAQGICLDLSPSQPEVLRIHDGVFTFPYTYVEGDHTRLAARSFFTTKAFVILKGGYQVGNESVKISLSTDKLSLSGPEDLVVQLLFGKIQVNEDTVIRGNFFSCDTSKLGDIGGLITGSEAYTEFAGRIPGFELLEMLPETVVLARPEEDINDKCLLYYCNPAYLPYWNNHLWFEVFINRWDKQLYNQNGKSLATDPLMIAGFSSSEADDGTAVTAYDNAQITAIRMRDELDELEIMLFSKSTMRVSSIVSERDGRIVTHALNYVCSEVTQARLSFEDSRRRNGIWPEQLVITSMLGEKKYAITYRFTDTDAVSLEEVICSEGQQMIPVEGRLSKLEFDHPKQLRQLIDSNELLQSALTKTRIDRKGSRRSDGERGLGFFLNRNNYEAPAVLLDQLARPLADWLPIMDKASRFMQEAEVNEDGMMAIYLEGMSMGEDANNRLPALPNLAIVGEAGTGKTTLAKKLVEDCMGGIFESVVGSDLKPVYIGWAKAGLASRINRIQKKHDHNRGPAVIFIDEAYNLFEEDKETKRSTADVLELLLMLADAKEDPDDPGYKYTIRMDELTDRDMKTLGLVENDDDGYSNDDDDDDDEVHGRVIREVKVRTDTYIWLGGYKDRLLASFRTNEGLSRRFERITIPSPKLPELHRYFNRLLSEDDSALIVAIRDDVENFLHWAKSPSISSIFGNYSGVERLVRYCKNRMKNVAAEEKQQAAIKAINELKAEILENYRYQLMSEIGRLPFEAVLDLHETLDDYAGAEQVKGKIRSIVDMMLDESAFRRFGVTLPKGALLAGPPGTGKTYLARCMAGELLHELQIRRSSKDVAFYAVSAGEVLGQNDPLKALSALFATATEFDYVIIFFDEIDAIGMQRDNNSYRSVLIQLMKEMDGFEDRKNLFVLAATNDPDVLDRALLREGRFDMIINVENPDRASSIALLTMYLNKYDIRYDELPETLQKRYLNLLGGVPAAGIKGMLNEAALMYLRCENDIRNELYKKFPLAYVHRRISDECYMHSEDPEHIDPEILVYDLKEVIDTKRIGNRKEKAEEENGFDITKNCGMSATAIHELGHAITAICLGQEMLERITILSRGEALGYVEYSRDAKGPSTRKEYLDQICISLGGRIAEEIIYGGENVSQGAYSDLQKAGKLARYMVGELGFSDELGLLVTGETRHTYLGSRYENYASEEMLAKRDTEAGKILDECAEETRRILSGRKEILLTLAKELYESQELSGRELKKRYEELQ